MVTHIYVINRLKRVGGAPNTYLAPSEKYSSYAPAKTEKKRIVQKGMSSSGLAIDPSLPSSSSTVQNILSSNKTFKYQKMKCREPLTSPHKIRRVEFAKKLVVFGENWQNIVFFTRKEV